MGLKMTCLEGGLDEFKKNQHAVFTSWLLYAFHHRSDHKQFPRVRVESVGNKCEIPSSARMTNITDLSHDLTPSEAGHSLSIHLTMECEVSH